MCKVFFTIFLHISRIEWSNFFLFLWLLHAQMIYKHYWCAHDQRRRYEIYVILLVTVSRENMWCVPIIPHSNLYNIIHLNEEKKTREYCCVVSQATASITEFCKIRQKKWELSTQHRENFIGELNPVHTTNRLFNWYVLCLTIVILVRRKMNLCDKFDTNTHVHNHWRAREIKKISAQFFFPTKKNHKRIHCLPLCAFSSVWCGYFHNICVYQMNAYAYINSLILPANQIVFAFIFFFLSLKNCDLFFSVIFFRALFLWFG